MVLGGYGMLSRAYKYEWENIPVAFLAFFLLLTGLGNSAGNNAAINVQAKSWGGSRRGTAMATVLSAFGLSAFLYSTLSHLFFAGNVTGYLVMLSVGSFASFLVGMSLLKIIPPRDGEFDEPQTGGQYARVPNEAPSDREAAEPGPQRMRRSRSSSEVSARVYAWLDDMAERDANTADTDDPFDEPETHHNDITGFALLREVDFILLFIIVSMVSGAGLLLINNVGTITRALWDYNSRKERGLDTMLESYLLRGVDVLSDKAEKLAIQRVQSLQVSCISMGNAGGRILIGVVSDYLVRISGEPTYRTWLLIPVTLLAILSQGLAAWPDTITDVHRLLFVSSLTGLMYGTLFGIGPVLVFEWFGITSFSQNWGYMSLSPVIGGNIYNLLFGQVYDSNVSRTSHTHRCHKGEECYRTVFIVTTVGCFIALATSAVLIVRRVKGVSARLDKALRSIRGE